MKCGHLFNGIGGFALAAHWMNWENVMHCEIDPFCNKVMNYHFPNSYQHEDIRATDFKIWRGKLDLITGGWPCQPVSTAGKRKGKDDVRYLWPENIRAVRQIRPRIVVGENVRGLTNWQGGVLFDEVQADLEAEGYEVLPFLLPAAGVNAPHRRDRIWFIAHANGSGFRGYDIVKENRCKENKNEGTEQREEWNEAQREWLRADVGGNGTAETIANPNGEYMSAMGVHKEGIKEAGLESFGSNSRFSRNDWQIFPTQPPICGGDDGLPNRLDDITLSKWKEGSLKALGNAVVPQAVYQIFKAIEQYENIIQNL